jgi:hypothetical protein
MVCFVLRMMGKGELKYERELRKAEETTQPER